MLQMALTRSLLTKQCTATKVFQNMRLFSSGIDFDSLVKKNKVVVFMKGTPNAPRCGFSNTVVQILKLYKVDFEAHDVLSDENMRQGIKEYSSWPTIPQVFINGEFVGGCDILAQMHYDNKFSKELEKAGIQCEPLKNLKEQKEEKSKMAKK